jgi:hypothetical protein
MWDVYPGSRIAITLSEIWFRIRDPGSERSGKNLFRFLDPGHRFPDPQHWSFLRTGDPGKSYSGSWIQGTGSRTRIRNTGRFSGLRDPGKTYSGSWIQGTGSRIRIRNIGLLLRTDGRDTVGSAEAVRAARHEAADLQHVQVHLHPLAPRHVLPTGPRDLALLYPGAAILSSCSF